MLKSLYYERDCLSDSQIEDFGITLRSSKNGNNNSYTRSFVSEQGVSNPNNTPRNVFCQKYNSSQFESSKLMCSDKCL